MEILNFKFNSEKALGGAFGITAGVVNSGNLEILLEKGNIDTEASFLINTTVRGFNETWQAVVADFAEKYDIGGCYFIINDCGATPAVVSLRLRQAYEQFAESKLKLAIDSRYLELNARERINALVDENSFTEWLKPECKITSPHLPNLDLPVSFDDGVIIGSAKFNQQQIYIASQNFAFMGGAIGEINGAKLTGLCLKALQDKPSAVVFLLDIGGVRLQEANAGEIAISEIIASVMQLRLAGIPVFGVVAGRNGAFGGIGILSKCLDEIVLTENARTGVSGPEVIETVMGSAEYDSSDRALVWRTSGGRHRSMMRDGEYAEKDMSAIKATLSGLLKDYQPLDFNKLINENQLLENRLKDAENCQDGKDIWSGLGYKDVENIPNLSDKEFLELLS